MQRYTATDSKLTVFDEKSYPIDYAVYNSRTKDHLVKTHSHDFYQLIYIIDGDLTIKADKKYECFKGDFIILPPRQIHSLSSKNGYKELLIGFKKCDDCENQHYALASCQNVFRASTPNLLPMVTDIAKWLGNLSTYSQSIIINYVNLFLLLAANHMTNSGHYDFGTRLSDYLDKHLESEISIDEISVALSISASHLQRLCHQYFGTGVKNLFNKKRFAKACALLTNTTLSSKEIGEITGFSTAANFSAFFKKHSGMSPLTYRKNNFM